MISHLPAEDWFINKPEALDFLNKVAREVHWLSLSGRDMDRIRYMLKFRHVRSSREPWEKGVLEFNFEMEKGRPGLGHIYTVEQCSDLVHRGSTKMDRRGRSYNCKPGKEDPIFIEKSIIDITGNDLDGIREMFVSDLLTV